MDPHHLMHSIRHEELLAAAEAHRLARACRRPRARPLLRLYARVWWASRPRVEAWPRALLEP